MRKKMLVLIGSLLGCSSPSCPCEDMVPLELSGVVTVDGKPYAGRIELWDSQWTDTAGDDVLLTSTVSSASGKYRIETEVEALGCGFEYYLRVKVVGLVQRSTGKPQDWVGSVKVEECGANQVFNIDLETPDRLVWPSQPQAAP